MITNYISIMIIIIDITATIIITRVRAYFCMKNYVRTSTTANHGYVPIYHVYVRTGRLSMCYHASHRHT